jgi:hypothetical protein
MTDHLKINPHFDFEKSNITASDIKNEVAAILNQVNEIQDELNPFPYDVFPEAIQQIIINTNQNLNFPIDFIGASMLFAASVAIGNTYRVEIKKGFLESAVLYIAIVARAGTNKSHPLSFALEPVFEHDKHTYSIYEQKKKEYDDYQKLSRKSGNDEQSEEPEKPFWRKLLVSDYTPEALVEVHSFNKRGIGVYADELAAWFKNFNRYNRGSEAESWLSAWNNKPITIDRKTGGPVYIPMPFISVAGTIQTGLLFDLAKDNRTHNGFIDRILFVFPDNIQKPCWTDTEIDPQIKKNWNSVISYLLSLTAPEDETYNPVPSVINFSIEAKEYLFSWQSSITNLCNDSDNDLLSGIYSKLEMYAARLALILELLKWACGESHKDHISLVTVKSAVKLVEYFKSSILKVYSIISSVNPLDKLSQKWQNLYYDLPDSFSTADGLLKANQHMIPARTFKTFITNKELFLKKSQGIYEKLF